jgi:hypothetical protein
MSITQLADQDWESKLDKKLLTLKVKGLEGRLVEKGKLVEEQALEIKHLKLKVKGGVVKVLRSEAPQEINSSAQQPSVAPSVHQQRRPLCCRKLLCWIN